MPRACERRSQICGPASPPSRRAVGRRRGSAIWRGASSCRASGSTCCSIPARPSSNSRRSRPTACTTRRCRRPASSPASAGSHGRECVIVANDATVKGGTYYPMTVKKHLRAQEIAPREPPALHLSGGFRRRQPAAPGRGVSRPRALRPHLLQPGHHVGRGHPADRRGHGLLHRRRCLRAGDVRRGHHRRGQGTIFLGGPPLVKAATGEVVSAEDLGGADVHASAISGVADHYAENDAHALAICRRIVAHLDRTASGAGARRAAPAEPRLRPGRALRRGAGRSRASPTTCAR